MVAAILPLYALYFLHASPAMFGVVDGLQQGGASLVKLVAGWFTDRSQRHKSVAAAGYLASAVSKFGLLTAAGGPSALTALVVLDRVGKGVRTAPRDAIISLSVPRGALASAFGIHRALDTTGAMLGPLLAFLVLRWIADGYDVVFAISLALALIGVAALVLFVDTSVIGAAAPAGQLEPALRWWSPRFVMIAVLAGAFGLATISDAFIYLSLQRKLGFDHTYLPLLFVATPAVYLTLAIPIGRLADRVGRTAVIVGGYAALAARLRDPGVVGFIAGGRRGVRLPARLVLCDDRRRIRRPCQLGAPRRPSCNRLGTCQHLQRCWPAGLQRILWIYVEPQLS